MSSASPALAGRFFTTGPPGKPSHIYIYTHIYIIFLTVHSSPYKFIVKLICKFLLMWLLNFSMVNNILVNISFMYMKI